MQEEAKALPWGAVWNRYCQTRGVAPDAAFMDEIRPMNAACFWHEIKADHHRIFVGEHQLLAGFRVISPGEFAAGVDAVNAGFEQFALRFALRLDEFAEYWSLAITFVS